MAAKIGSLIIDVSANVAKIQKDMGKVSKTVQSASDKMKKSVAKLKTAMAAMFTGLVLRQGVQFAEQLIDNADAMSKLAAKTGVSVEQLSAFGHAAELSGANVGVLSKGFKTLAANANDASMGTGEAKKAFDELDVSVMNSDGSLKDLDSLLLESADAISKLTDETKQAALASDIFGRAGFELLPFLKKGKDGIKEMTDEADRLGITIGTDFATSAAQLNDDITELKASFEGLARDAMPEVVTISKDVVSSLGDILQAYKDLKNFKPEDSVSVVTGSLTDMGVELLKLATPLGVVVRGYEQFSEALGSTADNADDVGNAFDSFDVEGFASGTEKAAKAVKDLKVNVEEGFDSFDTEAFEDYGKAIIEIIPIVEETATRSNTALESMGSIVGNVGRQISNFADGAKVDFGEMTQSILKDILRMQATKFLTGVFTGAFGGAATPTNTNVMSDLERVPVPAFAEGGMVKGPTLAMAGEAGPEAFFKLENKGGQLGISGSDSGGKTVVNIINQSNAKIETSSSTSNGIETITALIKSIQNESQYDGSMDQGMLQNYNIPRASFKR